jgi:hypothetical protein
VLKTLLITAAIATALVASPSWAVMDSQATGDKTETQSQMAYQCPGHQNTTSKGKDCPNLSGDHQMNHSKHNCGNMNSGASSDQQTTSGHNHQGS